MKTAFPEVARLIPGLDGLRAIAILLVFAYHSDLIEFGWAGVQLFFVLSGFLITGILLDMKASLPAREYFTKFYGRRFLRIFPLYYFYLAVMAVLAYWLMSVDFRPKYMQNFFNQVWYAVFYVYDLFYRVPGFQPSQFLDHFWSLSVEEQFYILWPLLLLFFPQRNLKKLFVLFIMMGVVFRLAMYWVYVSGSNLWLFREPFGLVLYSWPFSHLDAFALGAYISRYRIWRARDQLLFLALLVPAIGFTTTYLATGNLGLISALGYDLPLKFGYQFIWAPTILNYFFALLIYGVAHERILTKFLDLSWLRFLGKISYGMYVYHFPVLWLTANLLEERAQGTIEHWIYVGVSLFATILISTLSYYLLERPILNLKDRFFSWSPAEANKESG
jgi:peptidoglycan/LPS O-acetylase OafA/YrhL